MSPFISKSPSLCLTYSSVMMTVSPALSGASKETSSTILSITVCRRLAPMFSTVLFVCVKYIMRERIVEEVSFDAPDKAGETVIITEEYVKQRLGDLLMKGDMKKYIL